MLRTCSALRVTVLGAPLLLSGFLMEARGDPPSVEDVPGAIAKLGRQFFFGKISVEKDSFLPPDPDKARYAEQYNPDKPLTPGGQLPQRTTEQRARLLALYERFQREAVEGTRYRAAFELTLGPYEFVRYDYDYVSSDVRSVSVARTDSGCWLYNHGELIRFTWSGVPGAAHSHGQDLRIRRLLYEADYERDAVLNFGISGWKRHMVRGVERLDNGRLRATVGSPTGIWHAVFADQDGQLVLVERVRVQGDEETRFRYADIADVQGVLIPRHIVRTHGPKGAKFGDKSLSRFEYRVVDVRPGLGSDWAALFEPPDTWTDETGKEIVVLFEQSLDTPDAPAIPLHETAAADGPGGIGVQVNE